MKFILYFSYFLIQNPTEKNGITDFNYKSLLKYGSMMTLVHIKFAFSYLLFFTITQSLIVVAFRGISSV